MNTVGCMPGPVFLPDAGVFLPEPDLHCAVPPCPEGIVTLMPVQMPVVNSMSDVRADAESVASFFSETCAPGTNDEGPMDGGKAWDKMCSACKVR